MIANECKKRIKSRLEGNKTKVMVLKPTPFDDVNAILLHLLADAKAILDEQFFGLYLHGSLASGDFDYASSDIDFAIITNGDVAPDTLDLLRDMHEKIKVEHPNWGPRMEGVYIPKEALRRYDPARGTYPHLGIDEALRFEFHDSAEAIQRYILREYGVSIEGHDLRPLIDPISADELRSGVAIILRGWWKPMLEHPTHLVEHAGYQPYAVLTMCRMLYTLQTGTIISKPAAARWALETLGQEWHGLIRQAIDAPELNRADALDQTVAFIEYTMGILENKNPD